MANREALRELQNRLAAKLQAARTEARAPGWLAVESGGHGFLLPLAEAGEIFGVASLIPVPHTSRWFLGVANLRGGLHGVVDLAGFLGLRALTDGTRDGAQLVAFNPVFEINCALLVDRLAGLRTPEQVQAEDPGDGSSRPIFAGTLYRDAAGRRWQELKLAGLAREERFLRIIG
jgi:twitching motility protein PilI